MQRFSAVHSMSETGNTMSSERAEQAPVVDHNGVPGRALAAQRESMGWSVDQVAGQLKLAVRQIVAIEAGDYAALPAPAVVRGFVRAYAKIVNLDAAPLVAMIALEAPGPSDATGTTVRRDKPASFSEVRFPTHGKRASVPFGPIIGVGVVLAALAGAWYFGLIPGVPAAAPAGAPAATTAPAAAPVAAAPAAASAVVLAPIVASDPNVKTDAGAPLQSVSVPLISVPPPLSAAAASSQAATPAGAAPAPIAAPASAATATATAAPSDSANALVFNVHGDSWIEVKPVNGGKPLISRLVRAGSTETLTVTEPVTVLVGKPDAVALTLRGSPVALPPSPGKTTSRINLK
jgi:cytoskeleton protein RodZ